MRPTLEQPISHDLADRGLLISRRIDVREAFSGLHRWVVNRSRFYRPARGSPTARGHPSARSRAAVYTEPLAKTGNRPGFLYRKPQARDGQWAGRSV